ncbi:hypothetical protein [Glycomyces xiaoerkulensis]|uniref:hypothetical protein n=1 Tax=Glycomyces xiaoerkulensis TaxID=2038139 RepID=UPI0013001695|nr:hypothetical protein [Glycomyces xiaoerkulensis]
MPIPAGNGEMIHVIPDDSADGYSLVSSTDGRIIVADEDALDELGISLSDIESELEGTRDLVTNGNLTRVRGATFAMMPQIQFEQVDALNLKLGTFDDAEEVRNLYRENVYLGRAEQVERIANGYAVGRQVTEEIKTEYVNNDGDVAADINQINSEFDSTEGISESEVQEVQSENEALEGDGDGDAPQH